MRFLSFHIFTLSLSSLPSTSLCSPSLVPHSPFPSTVAEVLTASCPPFPSHPGSFPFLRLGKQRRRQSPPWRHPAAPLPGVICSLFFPLFFFSPIRTNSKRRTTENERYTVGGEYTVTSAWVGNGSVYFWFVVLVPWDCCC